MTNPLKAGRDFISRHRPRRYKGYEAIEDDDSVDWGRAMSQAIVSLDHAAHLAKKTNNSSGMREVAIGWLAVADSLGGPPRSGFETTGQSSFPVGFQGVAEEEEYEDGE